MANQFLALSLFVMLLSFFIILNSMSSYEELKAESIIQSLSISFSTKPVNEAELAPNIEEDTMESFREGDSLDRLNKLFSAQIAGIKASKNRLGTEMLLRLNLEDFEAQLLEPLKEGDLSQVERTEFMATLVSLLDAENDVPYRMDMVLNLNGNPAELQNSDPVRIRTAGKKVSGFAAKIEEAGLPPYLVTAGLGDGESQTIDLYFRRYEPFNPVGVKPE